MALDRDKILQTAQKHVDKKRFDKALAEYRKLVAEDPSDVRTLLKVGDLHLKLDQHEDAITTYEQVGDYYYREGFSVKAIAVYKQIRGIIRRHAPHLEGRYGHIVPRLAEIYTQLGLTSDALAAYDEVATRLRGEGRERDALDIFKKVVKLDPQNPIAHLRVADSRARLGDMDKAIERFGEAAEIMVKLGRLEDALKVLERLLEYRRDPTYARRAAQLYLERGGPNDGMAALTKLQVAFKNDPKDLDTLEMLAVAFDAINQPKKAVEVLKEAARVANDGGDKARFTRFLDTLLSRAPEDTLVIKLDKSRRAEASQAADVEVEVLEPEFIEENIENIEEVFELEDGDLETHHDVVDVHTEQPEAAARRLLYEAERQRAGGQLDAAIRMVRDGLRSLGSSRPLRERLSDLLLEAGDQHGAITEKLILAQELANEGLVEDAVRTLDEVLLLQPGNPDALQIRANLGYPLRTEQGIEDLTLNQPLQSYDVESGGVEEALHRSRHNSNPSMPALDDPFVPTNTGAHPQASDPSAGYGDPSAGYQQPQAQAPHHGHYDQSNTGHAPYSQPYSQPVVSQSGGSLDEGALDQAEVLAEQGRYDEARAILYHQLQTLPNHPLVLDRLADLDAMAAHATASHSGDYQRPSHAPYSSQHPPASYPPASYPPASYPQGGYDQVPQSQQRMGQQQVQAHTGEALSSEVDSLLDQVRQGVASQVDEGDAATHYDLGVAYQEMGLHQDAISELLLASRDPSRECVCLSMVGTIQLQLGDYDAALDALHRALNTQYKTRDQELAVGYEIANTYDVMQMPEQALQYFEWLVQVDANYNDPRGSLYDRIQRLRTESGALPRPQAPAPAPPSAEELGDAFGDAFEEG